MTEKLIKSADRVKNHGEVFTPKRIVDLMIDQPEINAKVNDLQATFLEPSAGEGAFLTEILARRMSIALATSSNFSEYNRNCLIGLASLYGIELLEDNVESLVMNMNDTFRDAYRDGAQSAFEHEPSSKVLNSAKVIIRANMAQGDALKRITSDGKQIILSEWASVAGKKDYVQRTEYTFDAIVDGSGPTGKVAGATQQLDLFVLDDDSTTDQHDEIKYVPCRWVDIYKEQLVE